MNFKFRIVSLTVMCFGLCACTKNVDIGTQAGINNYSPALSMKHVQEKVKYVPVPMPGQFMSTKNIKHNKHERLIGEEAIEAANKKSLKQPSSGEYINSVMYYNYIDGALYQVYCALYNVTDVKFQNNEHIVAVGAGDTSRWQVTKSYSGVGATRQEHLFIKPLEEDLVNSLVVTTDIRTYHLKLHSTSGTYMASVTWRYPDSEEDGILVKDLEDDGGASGNGDIANSVDVSRMHFNYNVEVLKGFKPSWYPKMVFNDGKKTYIKFPSNMQEAPNLLIGANGKPAQVINYRVQGDYYVVDNVVYYMQLSGGPDGKTMVQISPKK